MLLQSGVDTHGRAVAVQRGWLVQRANAAAGGLGLAAALLTRSPIAVLQEPLATIEARVCGGDMYARVVSSMKHLECTLAGLNITGRRFMKMRATLAFELAAAAYLDGRYPLAAQHLRLRPFVPPAQSGRLRRRISSSRRPRHRPRRPVCVCGDDRRRDSHVHSRRVGRDSG